MAAAEDALSHSELESGTAGLKALRDEAWGQARVVILNSVAIDTVTGQDEHRGTALLAWRSTIEISVGLS